MARVLLAGLLPEAVDFTDPALPPGMSAEIIRTGIAIAERQVVERGWDGDVLLFRPETAVEEIKAHLAGKTYDCIVIGAGVRLPPKNLPLLEKVINAIAAAAPGVPVAFNTNPQDSVEAAGRWLGGA